MTTLRCSELWFGGFQYLVYRYVGIYGLGLGMKLESGLTPLIKLLLSKSLFVFGTNALCSRYFLSRQSADIVSE